MERGMSSAMPIASTPPAKLLLVEYNPEDIGLVKGMIRRPRSQSR